MERWERSFIDFIVTGRLNFVGVQNSLTQILSLIKYEEKDDNGSKYPMVYFDGLTDWNIRFRFRDDQINLISVKFNNTQAESREVYEIEWYKNVKHLNIGEIEGVFQNAGIPYWQVLYTIDDKIDNKHIQTKGVPSVSVKFF